MMPECKCGCGEFVRNGRLYKTAAHRPVVTCQRCDKKWRPYQPPEDGLCNVCHHNVQRGAPIERRTRVKRDDKGRKWCIGCARYRHLKYFSGRANGLYARCKPCRKKQNHAYSLQKNFNITAEQYQQIKDAQGGKCAICRVATGASKALAVDHDHACCSGCPACIRGLLCGPCNRDLGRARDNVEYFRRAIDYLTDPPARKLLR